ncbi:MAG: DUF4388 domain-containing protein [bacterium]
MALDGQLSDFNLAEIFQLIASQQKNGYLTLETQPEMVFVFEKGTLISTRDRRSDGPDHLERYLRNYGFLNETQWRHIDFIKNNSSLDLTEILISEQFLEEDGLERVLYAVAQEMTFEGMRLRHGRYHFTSTRSTPKGIRGRFAIAVQSLLMEAARRMDEEPRLLEFFPTPAVTFQRGGGAPGQDGLSLGDRHLYKLALSGLPLGRIIRLGKLDSTTTRERLRSFCEADYLTMTVPGMADKDGKKAQHDQQKSIRRDGLRLPILLICFTLLLAGVGYLRWAPFSQPEISNWGLRQVDLASIAPSGWETAPDSLGDVSALLDPIQAPARACRLRQLNDEIANALQLFKYRHGRYPVDLSLLVKEGMLSTATYTTTRQLGWIYQLLENEQTYSLAG